MGLFSFFQGGAKYFDKKIEPKCDYCTYGKRTKDGNRVLCEKRGLVEQNYSCKAFIYSPLKRIPVKQLRFVGSIADDELYIESKGDRSEKEEAENKASDKNKKTEAKPSAPAAQTPKPDAPEPKTEEAEKPSAPQEQNEPEKNDKPSAESATPNNAPANGEKKDQA